MTLPDGWDLAQRVLRSSGERWLASLDDDGTTHAINRAIAGIEPDHALTDAGLRRSLQIIQVAARSYSLRMPSGEMTCTPTFTSGARFVRDGRAGRRVKRLRQRPTRPIRQA